MLKNKKVICYLCAIVLCLSSCSNSQKAKESNSEENPSTEITDGVENNDETVENPELTDIAIKEDNIMKDKTIKIKIDPSITYQTIESFGTSGSWWSQYVGGWDNIYEKTNRPVRDEIAMLLFDKEYGIGLTAYRYNVGAGSKESGAGIYWDQYRRASSFEKAPLVYDWNRDANSIWFLKRVVELGAEEIIFFCNSPLERLTINGTAQVSKGSKQNILPENYAEFATYVCDVVEHFIGKGIPIRFISPINEPQWDWFEGQEGCHYEPTKIAGVYKAFLAEIELRPALSEVELSGPESGEWGGDTILYTSALLNDSILSQHFTTIDNHSYWTSAASKNAFKNWMNANHPDIKLRTSEWCEMVNGSDVTMDSAFNLAKVLVEDLTILNVVSWQNWVGVAPGGYRDGLIYVNQEKKTLNPLKRLWGYGNYTKFIRPGYTMVDVTVDKAYENLMPVAFTGVNSLGQEELVIVLMNNEKETKHIKLDILGNLFYTEITVYETSPDKNLECINETMFADGVVELGSESITTIILR